MAEGGETPGGPGYEFSDDEVEPELSDDLAEDEFKDEYDDEPGGSGMLGEELPIAHAVQLYGIAPDVVEQVSAINLHEIEILDEVRLCVDTLVGHVAHDDGFAPGDDDAPGSGIVEPQIDSDVFDVVQSLVSSVVRGVEAERGPGSGEFAGEGPGAAVYDSEEEDTDEDVYAQAGPPVMQRQHHQRQDSVQPGQLGVSISPEESQAAQRLRRGSQSRRRAAVTSRWQELSVREQRGLAIAWDIESKSRNLYQTMVEALGPDFTDATVPLAHWKRTWSTWKELSTGDDSNDGAELATAAIDSVLTTLELVENSVDFDPDSVALNASVAACVQGLVTELQNLERELEVMQVLDDNVQIVQAMSELLTGVQLEQLRERREENAVGRVLSDCVDVVAAIDGMLGKIEAGDVDYEFSGSLGDAADVDVDSFELYKRSARDLEEELHAEVLLAKERRRSRLEAEESVDEHIPGAAEPGASQPGAVSAAPDEPRKRTIRFADEIPAEDPREKRKRLAAKKARSKERRRKQRAREKELRARLARAEAEANLEDDEDDGAALRRELAQLELDLEADDFSSSEEEPEDEVAADFAAPGLRRRSSVMEDFLEDEQDNLRAMAPADSDDSSDGELNNKSRNDALRSAVRATGGDSDDSDADDDLRMKLEADKAPAYVLFPGFVKRGSSMDPSVMSEMMSEFQSFHESESDASQNSDDSEDEGVNSISALFEKLDISQDRVPYFEDQELQLEDLRDLSKRAIELLLPEKADRKKFIEWRKRESRDVESRVKKQNHELKKLSRMHIPDTIEELFERLKIHVRYADYWRAEGKGMSSLAGMSKSELHELMPTKGPRTRLRNFIKSNVRILKQNRARFIAAEAAAAREDRILNPKDYVAWLQRNSVKERQAVADKMSDRAAKREAYHAFLTEFEPDEAQTRYPVEPESDSDAEADDAVDLDEEARKVVANEDHVEEWETLVRVAERGHASLTELAKATDAHAHEREDAYQPYLDALAHFRGERVDEFQRKKTTSEEISRFYNPNGESLAPEPRPARSCTSNDGCTIS